jgi:hypothetical protein
MLVKLFLYYLAITSVKSSIVHTAKPYRNRLPSRSRLNVAQKYGMLMMSWRVNREEVTDFPVSRIVASPTSGSCVRGDAKFMRAPTKQKRMFQHLASLPFAYAAVGVTMSGTYFWLMRRLGPPFVTYIGASVISGYLVEYFDSLHTSKLYR